MKRYLVYFEIDYFERDDSCDVVAENERNAAIRFLQDADLKDYDINNEIFICIVVDLETQEEFRVELQFNIVVNKCEEL